jgi:hypothetical protein
MEGKIKDRILNHIAKAQSELQLALGLTPDMFVFREELARMERHLANTGLSIKVEYDADLIEDLYRQMIHSKLGKMAERIEKEMAKTDPPASRPSDPA